MNLLRYHKIAGNLVMIGVLLFIVLTFLAMILYPGGAQFYPSTQSYSFIHNYFSDLGGLNAHNGESNLISASLFLSSLFIIGICVIPLFIIFPFIFNHGIVEKYFSIIATTIGLVASIAYIGIGITPYDVFSYQHNIFVSIAFTCAFIFLIVYTVFVFFNHHISNFFGYINFLYIIAITLNSIVLLLYFDYETPQEYMILVIAQKIVVYSELICLFVQGYGLSTLKFVK
ncbi:MAG: hypothetical protein GF317_22140 [Candidatus Lokiarchaeota archaeon]|nr:hypothetical protein [Candidatus Lokiarchaeota archaeon]MBD3202161.1 hypothetical protein [Candidatus Lokiarchaeota archaeon]